MKKINWGALLFNNFNVICLMIASRCCLYPYWTIRNIGFWKDTFKTIRFDTFPVHEYFSSSQEFCFESGYQSKSMKSFCSTWIFFPLKWYTQGKCWEADPILRNSMSWEKIKCLSHNPCGDHKIVLKLCLIRHLAITNFFGKRCCRFRIKYEFKQNKIRSCLYNFCKIPAHLLDC